jgi:hypothetical protein
MSIKKNILNILIISILISYSVALDFNYLKQYFYSFLQKNVSNKAFIKAAEAFRKLTPKEYPNNLQQNIKAFPNHSSTIKKNNGYIEDQSQYTDMVYGIQTISQSGCNLIAVYNALYDLTEEENINFPEIIDYFEQDGNGIILYGYFGTAPQAAEEYFRKLGFKTQSSTEKEDYLNIQNSCDAFILTIYNNVDDITRSLHTLSISKRNGKFWVHNNGGYGHLIEYNSILDILEKINNGKSKDIMLIGIQKKQ